MHRIKKILAVLLSCCLLLGLTACGGSPEEKVAGWWSVPEELGSPVRYMQLEPETGTMTYYSKYGQPSAYFDYEMEDRQILVDMDFDSFLLELDGDELLDEYGEVQFVKISEPEFEKIEGFDGTWYHLGNPDSDPYVIQGTSCQKNGVDMEYTPVEGNLMIGEDTISTGIRMSGEFPNPDLESVAGLPMLAVRNMDYEVYIREDKASEYHEEAVLLEALLNDTMRSEEKDGSFYLFSLYPVGFQVTEYTIDAVGSAEPGASFGGTWELQGLDTLVLSYTDGSTDTVLLPTEGVDFDRELDIAESVLEGGTFTVDSLDAEFTISGF